MTFAMNKLRKETVPYSVCEYNNASSGAEPEQEQAEPEQEAESEQEQTEPKERIAHDKSVKIFQEAQGFGHAGFYKSMSHEEQNSWRKYLQRRYKSLQGFCKDLTRDTNAIMFVGILPNKKMHIKWPKAISSIDYAHVPGGLLLEGL